MLDLKGLLELRDQKKIERAYAVTRALDNFGPMAGLDEREGKIMKLPAQLRCCWMGTTEVSRTVCEAGADVVSPLPRFG